jgi:signal peptidase I
MKQKVSAKGQTKRKKIEQPSNKKKHRPQKSPSKTDYVTNAVKKTSKPKKAKVNRKKSMRKKKSQKRKRSERRRQFYKEIGISFLLLMSLFFLLQWLFFSLPTVNGYGMTPTLNDGDRLYVSKHSEIKRFDMIYFKNPVTGQVMIRRVIALPEEEIAYVDDQLMINQNIVVERFLANELKEAQAEKRLLTEDFSLGSLTGSRALPADSYFVLGDNRHYAADSRQFGWVEKENILGVVKTRVLPFHNMTQF